MRRFFLEPELLLSDRIELPADTLKHLLVLRLNVGDQIELLDGKGLSCRCELLELNKKRALAEVLKRNTVHERGLSVELYQGMPKGDKLELILQKGTELGITRFCPTLCQRSQTSGPKAESMRHARWSRVIKEAARQSMRSLLPCLAPPVELANQLIQCKAELRLTLWEEARRPLAEVLPPAAPQSVALLIGPEGGLTHEEVELASDHGFLPVSLGPRILRTETAGFAVAGILQYLYGDMGRSSGPDSGN